MKNKIKTKNFNPFIYFFKNESALGLYYLLERMFRNSKNQFYIGLSTF